jgi:hypothetical protein
MFESLIRAENSLSERGSGEQKKAASLATWHAPRTIAETVDSSSPKRLRSQSPLHESLSEHVEHELVFCHAEQRDWDSSLDHTGHSGTLKNPVRYGMGGLKLFT